MKEKERFCSNGTTKTGTQQKKKSNERNYNATKVMNHAGVEFESIKPISQHLGDY